MIPSTSDGSISNNYIIDTTNISWASKDALGIENWLSGGIIMYLNNNCEALLEIWLGVVKSITSSQPFCGWVYQLNHLILFDFGSWDTNCELFSIYFVDVCANYLFINLLFICLSLIICRFLQ